MRVLSLEIENILSIEKAFIQFEDSGMVLVEGWNYDTQRANGAGKTAIFNGLSFALYDKLPRKITMSEILRRGSKSGFAKASVLCGEDTWSVRRDRPKGVTFEKNGVRQDITQDEFISIIRLTYEQFLLTIYSPQQNTRQLARFLGSADTAKKEFLLQLLNLNQFSDVKKQADEIVKANQSSIDLEEKKLSTARSKISAYEESLVDVESLSKSIEKWQSAIAPVNAEILTLSGVARPDFSKYSAIEDKIRTKQANIAQAKAKRGMLHERYRDLNSKSSSYGDNPRCGECGALLESAESREAHAKHQVELQNKIIDIKSQIDAADEIIAEEQVVIDLSRKLRDKKNTDSIDYQEAQNRIGELKQFVAIKTSEIEVGNQKLKSNVELLNKINTLQNDVSKFLTNISTNRQQLELYKTLSAIYSPTGAQAYVLDSIVDSFNEVIQKYIDLLSPNITYTLNSFKETGKGDIVAKFSETLMKSGKEVSVGSLSGGEEKGLSLCVDFALLEVLETQFGMSLNPIILDEPFDGLDAAGRELVIELLEILARNRQIFVVDHASEAKALFSKSIRIELRNEISSISADT